LNPVLLVLQFIDLNQAPAAEEGKEEHAGNKNHQGEKVFPLDRPEKTHNGPLAISLRIF
jgi:hypothetical protein